MKFEFKPIGVIHTPFKEKEGMPIQGSLFPEATGKVEVYSKFTKGLKDVEGFSHIILLFAFHRSRGYDLISQPFLENEKRGVFSMRSPKRPNPIGMTVVKLSTRSANMLFVSGVDMLDRTPLLDIKPYVPEFDNFKEVKIGWLQERINKKLSDDRFSK